MKIFSLNKNMNMNRNEKIQYCLDNKIFVYKETNVNCNKADLETMTEEDLDKAISEHDKAVAFGAG
jgi:hypothetical protein